MNYVTPIIIWYIIGIIVSISFLFLYNYFMPMNNWIEYKSVEPLQKENIIWENFYMVSMREFTRDSNVEWFDVMICNNNWRLWRYSAMKSEWKVNPSALKETSRKYLEDTPKTPRDCYMVSTITLKLILWIQKKQTLVSTWFSFIH
jgi:hypothetical protein